jgi:tRNA pseudouridine13 synthase
MESKSTSGPPRDVRLPFELPFEHPDLPALGGHIGPEPEDFVVDELPLYAASGQGDHWYVRLGKRGRTTADLRAAVVQASGALDREVGYAGMKDKHAVTTQWFSVPVSRTKPPAEWQLSAPFSLLEVTRHSNKLRIGHSAGNRFRIRLVDVAPEARSRLAPLCERIAAQGIGNYFGSQRFGLGQRNLETALGALRRGRLGPRAGQRGKFLASVIQSEVYNRYLAARSELGRERVLVGDVVRLEGSRSLFVVEDVEREAPRLAARDIHLTGPLIGPKMKESEGQPRTLELAAEESLGLDAAALSALSRAAPGTRRDLVLRPEGLRSSVAEDGSLITEFSLPSGAYASLVIRALTRQDPWQREGASREGDDAEASERSEEVAESGTD